MVTTLARPKTEGSRFFPLPASPYKRDGGFSGRLGERGFPLVLLGFEACPQRIKLGLRLKGTEWVQRLFFLHKEGVAAETKGCFRRADAFWRSVQRTVAGYGAEHPIWKHALAYLEERGTAVNEVVDEVELRRRFILEVIVDTHCAFINGRLEERVHDARSLAHLVHIQNVLAATDVGPRLIEDLVVFSSLAYLDAFLSDDQYKDAERLARKFAEIRPGDTRYQDRIVHAMIGKPLDSLRPDETGDAAIATANKLTKTIQLVEDFRRHSLLSVGCYEALALLSHLQAVSWANGGRPSRALRSVEFALAYSPGWSEAKETRGQIERMLKQLQQQMELVALEMGVLSDPNARTVLNEQGRVLMSEATTGTKLRDQSSSERHRIRGERKNADANYVWNCVGLHSPDAQSSPKYVYALEKIIANLRRKEPEGVILEDAAWSQIVEQHAKLQLGDAHRECIRRHVAPSMETASRHELPALRSEHESTTFDAGPFDLWLFSWRDLGAKMLATAATVILTIGVGMAVMNRYRANERDSAFSDLIVATKSIDDADARLAAQRFLANPSSSRPDERRGQVLSVLDDCEKWPVRRARDAAYAKLIELMPVVYGSRADSDARALAASEDFLSALVDSDEDPRTKQVIGFEAAAMTAPARRVRDSAYEQLVAGFGRGDEAAVQEWAGVFLEALPEGVGDARTRQVQQLCAYAIDGPNRRARNAAYERLLAHVGAADDFGVVIEAENFLESLLDSGFETRTDQIVRLYDEAFARWFARGGQDDLRIGSYQSLRQATGE